MCPKCRGWVRRECRGGAGQGLTMTGMVSAHSSSDDTTLTPTRAQSDTRLDNIMFKLYVSKTP